MEFDLDTVLLSFQKDTTDVWTIRNAVEGVQIFGGIGSGKTSGSGRTLALKYLKAGFGGLVLTVKPDEKDLWMEYCGQAGRLDDVVLLEPGGTHRFNFLEYESSRGSGEVFTQNIAEVLKTVIRASDEKSTGAQIDGFWESALDLLIYNCIDLCLLAYDSVSIQKLYDIVQTAARGNQVPVDKNSAFREAFGLAKEVVMNLDDRWHERQRTVEGAWNLRLENWEQVRNREVPQIRIYNLIYQFFFQTYQHLAEKTRSIIEFSFSSFLYNLLREPSYSLFCSGHSTFVPEDSLKGKIILLNLPVKLYHQAGRDCQVLFKYLWQRAMERRDVRENGRPVFLWADEAQHFLHEHDAEFQATARSSRVATVYLSQNLPNYHASMGGSRSESRVKSFLGTLATKIFHANADVDTNQYASSLIGEAPVIDTSKSKSIGKDFSSSTNESLKYEPILRPEDFASLATGGQMNNHLAVGVLHRQGSPFQNGRNHLIVPFKQAAPTHSL